VCVQDASIDLLERGVLQAPPTRGKGEVKPLVESSELIETLMVAYRSLCDTGLTKVADGSLRDLIRQLKCFGLTLLPLDCRNESVRHSEALDAITRYLGIGSYLSWDEETRQAWLLKELNEKRPLLPHCKSSDGGYSSLGSMFDETVCDVLGTFDVIAEIPGESLGACMHCPSFPLAVHFDPLVAQHQLPSSG
jgi:phosphoenolpyruvate carboxylase